MRWGAKKKIAESILGKGADYLLAVKENQPNLYKAINNIFFDEDEEIFNKNFVQFAEQTNGGHGRIETRRCWVCEEISALPIDTSEWKELTSIVVIESTRTESNKTTVEHRMYISSASESAEYFLKSARDHWHVENKLHWVLDVSFREDESRIRKGDGAENFSILRRIALNLGS